MLFLKEQVIISIGSLKRKDNYLYSVKVKYKTKNKNYSFNIKFGGKDSWYKSSVWSNNFDQFITFSYAESVYEEGSKVLERDEEISPGMIVLLSSVVVNIWLNAWSVSSSNKKRYNAVWGNKGVDPKNKRGYFLFEVSKQKSLNGLYVYSLKNNEGRKIKI